MTVELKPLPFEEAIAFFRGKTPVLPEQYAGLEAAARARAFSVSGVSRMDVMNDLFSAMDKSVSEGRSFGQFKKEVRGIMEKRGWDGVSPHRLDTIFRTNIQSAYQAGHYAQMSEVTDSRPFWQYVAVMDSRTRPAHARMNGKVFRHDDPFWKTSFPPNGFNCRCTVVSVSGSELKSDGISVGRNGQSIADKGFDTNPGEAWQPDLNKYSFDLASQYIASSIKGPDFERFFNGAAKGNYPVAVLNAADKAALKSESQSVIASSQTIEEHIAKHPELTLADYRKIPYIISQGEVYQQGDMRLIYLWDDGILYRVGVKVTENRQENYFLTLFKTRDKDADRQVRRKLERIR